MELSMKNGIKWVNLKLVNYVVWQICHVILIVIILPLLLIYSQMMCSSTSESQIICIEYMNSGKER